MNSNFFISWNKNCFILQEDLNSKINELDWRSQKQKRADRPIINQCQPNPSGNMSYLWHSLDPRIPGSSGSVRPHTPHFRCSLMSIHPLSLENQKTSETHVYKKARDNYKTRNYSISNCVKPAWLYWMWGVISSGWLPRLRAFIRLVWSSCYHSLGNGQAFTYT